jgi:3'(2'), 5'-bisphosphate nucleotidase
MNEKELLKKAIEAAILAGEEILEVYKQEFTVDFKEDKSPLTLADRRAHEIISKTLKITGLPLLSEEGRHTSYDIRKDWEYFWLVDPLDGTKEFIRRNGEFTVNIALIFNGKPVMGIIFVPVTRVLYFAYLAGGAFKTVVPRGNYFIDQILEQASVLPSSKLPAKLTVVASRSHMSPETLDYVEGLKKTSAEVEFISIGSSLKLCLVAEGKAHIYPRFGPTMEWDTAAGQAIVEISGGIMITTDAEEPVRYNKPDLLNPWFIAKRPY